MHAFQLPAIALATALLAPWTAQAQVAGPRSESLPTSLMLGVESVRLPQGEHMGLVGGSLLFDIGGDWGLGPSVYSAATGHRGGLFVGGVELQRRWSLGPGVSLATGLYAGGGGGAAAPVGGGLMLRPAVTLLKDLGPSLQAGLSWSSVRFPSGQIRSNQLGLMFAWRTEFIHLTGASGEPASTQETGLGFDRIAATATAYRFSDGSGRRIGLVGARAERRSYADGLTWGLEAAAAAQGNAAGYMEILGSAALSLAPLPTALPTWRVGVRLGTGLGGGGAVPTDGGIIAKATGTTEWSPVPGWTIGADVGLVRGVNGPLRAKQAQVWLGIDLEPGIDGRGRPAGHAVKTEWVGAIQHHLRTQRADGTRRPLDTIGLKLNRYVGDYVYVSGQAHSAFAGGAGAYSVGLVGAGVAVPVSAPLRIGIEALIGAAGGGGVSTSGGSIAEGLAWAGWKPSPASEWRVGLGSVRPLRGGPASPLAELSWSRSFGMAGR